MSGHSLLPNIWHGIRGPLICEASASELLRLLPRNPEIFTILDANTDNRNKYYLGYNTLQIYLHQDTAVMLFSQQIGPRADSCFVQSDSLNPSVAEDPSGATVCTTQWNKIQLVILLYNQFLLKLLQKVISLTLFQFYLLNSPKF